MVVVLEFGRPIRIFEGTDVRRATRYAGGFVAGVDDRFSLTGHDGSQQGLQINFTPLGARLFFGVPMSELSGRVVHFRDLVPPEQHSLAERLEAQPDWDARFDLVERLLTERIASAHGRSDAVAWAVRHIEASGGAVDVRSLVRELGYSHKHVITLFRDQVGVPPGLLARIVRFDRLMRHLKRGGPGTWAELAVEFGYYDQAHLVNEVRRFTGTTPTEVRAMLVDLTIVTEASR
ncbi:MAG: AraC family transcriptional regulator [Myxococcaceae bacterium]|nr:AraC family transcriptional regulator [Myxococcaceae bacterium]MCI0673295.1 AraC family transcriptional regulator [Myxococcaceae bacterium]